MRHWLRIAMVVVAVAGLAAGGCGPGAAAEKESAKAPAAKGPGAKMPVVFEENFEKGHPLKKWAPTDPGQWKIATDGGTKVLALHVKRSKYRPKVRSPYSIALIRDLYLGDFVMDLKMKSTNKPYGHLDLCLFFGHQDPTHFYYAHIALRADPRAHSIMVVDNKPRVSIVKKRNKGIVWGDKWHHVRLVRRVKDGTVEVYFDDMTKPIMSAVDKRFSWGRVGVGSFDDIGNYDEIKIRGIRVQPPKKDKPVGKKTS